MATTNIFGAAITGWHSAEHRTAFTHQEMRQHPAVNLGCCLVCSEAAGSCVGLTTCWRTVIPWASQVEETRPADYQIQDLKKITPRRRVERMFKIVFQGEIVMIGDSCAEFLSDRKLRRFFS